MRFFIFIILFSCIAACTSNTRSSLSKIRTIDSTPIDFGLYDRELKAKGLYFYCDKRICDKPPKFIHGDAPIYPPTLLAIHEDGEATIIFTINKQGTPVDFEVESATAQEFADAAIQALSSWKFIPATLHNKAVPTKARQQFFFRRHFP